MSNIRFTITNASLRALTKARDNVRSELLEVQA